MVCGGLNVNLLFILGLTGWLDQCRGRSMDCLLCDIHILVFCILASAPHQLLIVMKHTHTSCQLTVKDSIIQNDSVHQSSHLGTKVNGTLANKLAT